MIISPENWQQVGQRPSLERIENKITAILEDMDCRYLSFSGGLDSSLMLYFMIQVYGKVELFTIGKSEKHPDVVHSKDVAAYFGKSVKHHVYIPTEVEIVKVWQFDILKQIDNSSNSNHDGDDAVRLFYQFVAEHTDRIIACDGIDEYACGYYAHQDNPTEETYYNQLWQLCDRHLLPLDVNSGMIDVYLPYLDSGLLVLLNQIPIADKVDSNTRKKILVEIAKGKLPDSVINRRKYGLCQALVDLRV